MAREPLTYERVEGLPTTTREGSGGGAGRTSPYQTLIQECVDNPGQWFRSTTETKHQAYSRAATLRKHGLDAHARGVDVYVSYKGDDTL